MYQIVVTTLQQLSRLSKYKQLQIYLVSSHAIDLKVLALIEDALLEYLDYEQLTIHTSLSSDEMADIHYVLLFND